MKASHDSYLTKDERLDKIEESLSSVNELKELLIKSFEKKEVKAEPVKPVFPENFIGDMWGAPIETAKSISDGEKFAWAGLGLFVSSLASWILWHSPFFSVAFAFAIVFSGLLLLIFIDWKYLKGDSIGKVAQNGISVAIFWFAIVMLFACGMFSGERISPDRIAGEAQQAVERRFDSFDNKLDSIKSNSIKPAKNEIEIGNDGIPNR